MNFKDEYKRDYAQITTDEAFRSQLAEKMNKTAPAKVNIKMITTVVSAAAVVALVIVTGALKPAEKEIDITLKGETAATQSLTEGLFDINVWYGNAASDEEIYAEFSRLMSDGSLETLYCSDDSAFDDADILDSTDMNRLAEKLAAAEQTEEIVNGTEKRCMAVFSGGEIIKFSLWNDEIVKLDDCGKTYKIK